MNIICFFAEKYIDFKNNIHQLFPTIYDTKFLSYELKKILQIHGNYLKYLFIYLYDYKHIK